MDARTQTEYGILRSFTDLASNSSTVGFAGGTSPSGGAGVTFDRAFIQFAGFTAGRIRSFFDVVAPGPFGLSSYRISGDTAGGGTVGMAYTFAFSGGWSLSLEVEDPGYADGGRGRSTVDLGYLCCPGASFNNIGTNNHGAYGPFTLGSITTQNRSSQFPDPVAALRLDQDWGFFQVAGAMHENGAGYYSNPAVVPCSGGATNLATGCGIGPNNVNGGLVPHPRPTAIPPTSTAGRRSPVSPSSMPSVCRAILWRRRASIRPVRRAMPPRPTVRG